MKRSILKLESVTDSNAATTHRTIFKTQHGRSVYLDLAISGADCVITDCFYPDRNQGRTGTDRYSAKPLKLQTLRFPVGELLSVIAEELDKQFYGMEFVQTAHAGLSLDAYLEAKAREADNKYRFLIMVGDGEAVDGLPRRLMTRMKNNLHRAIYVEIAYHREGMGVVKRCHYYDRQYKRQDHKVTPPQLISCFFPYSHEGILNLFNQELWCSFTHVLVTEGIDLDSNTVPLCGAL